MNYFLKNMGRKTLNIDDSSGSEFEGSRRGRKSNITKATATRKESPKIKNPEEKGMKKSLIK